MPSTTGCCLPACLGSFGKRCAACGPRCPSAPLLACLLACLPTRPHARLPRFSVLARPDGESTPPTGTKIAWSAHDDHHHHLPEPCLHDRQARSLSRARALCPRAAGRRRRRRRQPAPTMPLARPLIRDQGPFSMTKASPGHKRRQVRPGMQPRTRTHQPPPVPPLAFDT